MSCSSEEEPKKEDHLSVFCGAETVNGANFVNNGNFFIGSSSQSSKKARSGKFSVGIHKDDPYGISYEIKDVKKGDVIQASVWKHKDRKSGKLVISTGDPINSQYEYAQFFIKEEKKWGKIEMFFIAQHNYQKVVVFAHNSDEEPVYFDDLKIDIYTNNKKPSDLHSALEITIDDSAFDTLSKFRKVALEQGVITSDLKEYIKAEIKVKGQMVPVELRLKGDWTDHLETNKWSFRIKVGKGNAYKGMRTFSIQNPSTRSFMKEWFAHKLYEKEDVLTTRYIFVPVIINGKKMGVYALEEHFDKQLLEYRKRREGPIVKYDESGVWQLHYSEKNEGKYYHVPALESADILPFKKKRTFKSPTLSQQFKVAQGHMQSYRDHDVNVDDYFDVESMARFIALTDVLNGKHGSVWHNQRNYYNPITRKLEPIAYDCFMGQSLLTINLELVGLERKNAKQFNLIEAALSNEKLEGRYFELLKKYSDSKYLDQVFKEMEGEIRKTEKLLNYEYPNIKFDKSFFRNNCSEAKKQLKTYAKHRKSPNAEIPATDPFTVMPKDKIFTDIGLKVNIEEIYADKKVRLSLRNFHSAEIKVIGYSLKKKKDSIIPLSSTLRPYNHGTVLRILNVKEKPSRIFYKVKNCGDKIFKCKLNKWSTAKKIPMISKSAVVLMPKKGSTDIILRGDLSYSRDHVVPKGYRLIVEAGTNIKLSNNASFVSFSPITMNGTADDIITISSPDGTANGFVVLSDQKSRVTMVTFDNMSTMNKNNWTLTGAVTFYGGEVFI